MITNDNITLELTNATIQSIFIQTETYLASLQAPPETITELYQTFLAQNHITDREPLPILQRVLTTNSPTTPTNPLTSNSPTKSTSDTPPELPTSSYDSQPKCIQKRKRKPKQQHLAGRKQKKQEHFLSLSPSTPPVLP